MRLNIDLFHPLLVFLVCFAIFYLLAVLGSLYVPIPQFPPVSMLTVFLIVLGIVMLITGIYIGQRKISVRSEIKWVFLGVALALYVSYLSQTYLGTFLGILPLIAVLAGGSILYLTSRILLEEEIMPQLVFVVAGGVLLISNFVLIGAPLLNPQFRLPFFSSPITFIGIFLFLVGICAAATNERFSKLHVLAFLAAGILLFSFTGSRGYVVWIAIGICGAAYYSGKFGFQDVVGVLGTALLVIVGVGYLVASMVGFRLGPIEILIYRAAFSTGTFNRIVQLSGLAGFYKGSFWFTEHHEAKIAELIYHKAGVGVTSTFFGPLVLDGGVIELVLITLLIGIVLGLGHRLAVQHRAAAALYGLTLAKAVIWINEGFGLYGTLFYALAIFTYLWLIEKSSGAPQKAWGGIPQHQ